MQVVANFSGLLLALTKDSIHPLISLIRLEMLSFLLLILRLQRIVISEFLTDKLKL